MGRELHAIATFAGHRSTESTMRYIHLSGRELSDKLNRAMAGIHTQRVGMLTANAACSGDIPGRPGTAEARAPCFAVRQAVTTADRSTWKFSAASRWSRLPSQHRHEHLVLLTRRQPLPRQGHRSHHRDRSR